MVDKVESCATPVNLVLTEPNVVSVAAPVGNAEDVIVLALSPNLVLISSNVESSAMPVNFVSMVVSWH